MSVALTVEEMGIMDTIAIVREWMSVLVTMRWRIWKLKSNFPCKCLRAPSLCNNVFNAVVTNNMTLCFRANEVEQQSRNRGRDRGYGGGGDRSRTKSQPPPRGAGGQSRREGGRGYPQQQQNNQQRRQNKGNRGYNIRRR